jgi:hypothetical protein
MTREGTQTLLKVESPTYIWSGSCPNLETDSI